MAKVFLSYARDDAALAAPLADAIGKLGYDVWWDRHLQGGTRFASEIDQALKQAAVVVVIWSSASVDSAWVQDEAAEGRDTGRLVPVCLNGSRPPLGFRQFHSVELGNWNGEGPPDHMEELAEAIAKIAAAHAPAPLPAAEEKPKLSGPAVCVLPFINMSGEPEQEYFSDGITEDIITDLSKVSALHVISRNTAFTFKGKILDLKDIARQLDVTHVLEGSVRKAGTKVRITAQLIDGSSGGHVWAERYDRELDDIFEIQDEISRAIVAAMQVKLLPKERRAIETRGTSSVEAYNLYLMARQHWVSGSYGEIRRDETVVRICQQATNIDPDYAEAWALMSIAQSELRFWHGKDVDPMPSVERALAINPDLAEPHCVKARILEEKGALSEANDEVQLALKLSPDAWEVNREAARLMFRQGRIEEAIPFFEKAASVQDSDWHNLSMLVTCYHAIGDTEKWLESARKTFERAQKAIAKDPSNAAAYGAGAAGLAVGGDKMRAREWMDRALLLDPDNISLRYNLACGLTVDLGDHDRAMDYLEPYLTTVMTATQVRHLEADPDLDALRDRPRFKAMVAAAKKRLNLDS